MNLYEDFVADKLLTPDQMLYILHLNFAEDDTRVRMYSTDMAFRARMVSKGINPTEGDVVEEAFQDKVSQRFFLKKGHLRGGVYHFMKWYHASPKEITSEIFVTQ